LLHQTLFQSAASGGLVLPVMNSGISSWTGICKGFSSAYF